MAGDNCIYTLVDHKMVRIGEPASKSFTDPLGIVHIAEERHNFLIVCEHGDWSGFRTLKECLDQINNSPDMLAKSNFWYQIVERL